MVLGSKGKNRRGGAVQTDCIVHIQEIKPWPPSQSLKSIRSVLIHWENGERLSGSTNPISPSPGSVVGEGKIEVNESFRLPVTLLRDMSVKNSIANVFQKNCLEFNLYEPRRDKIVKGQLLGTAIIDLAECGVLKEPMSISVPLNCTRNYRNTDQPLLYIKIEPVDKNRSRSSLKNGIAKEATKENIGDDFVSSLMNEEYAEEAEFASLTDDDVSSHSSAAAATTSSESSGCVPPEHAENGPDGEARNNGGNEKENPLVPETRDGRLNMLQEDRYKRLESPSSMTLIDVSSNVGSPVNGQASMKNSPNHSSAKTQKQFVSPSADSSSPSLEGNSNSRSGTSYCEHLDQEVCEEVPNESALNTCSNNSTSLHSNHFVGKNSDPVNWVSSEINEKSNELHDEADKYHVKNRGSANTYYSSVEDTHGNEISALDIQTHVEDESVAQGVKDQVLLSSGTYYLSGSESHVRGNIMKSERLKHVKSVRSSAEAARSIGSLASNHLAEVNEGVVNGDAQNSGGTIRSSDKRDSKIYPREARTAILDSKVEHLENKIRMLEGELREAAAIEAALYSVIAEHGSSMSKVHAPARRLSRLYLHACKENIPARRSGAAKSAVSGLVLVAKACGNDVPRLTFWLSNSIVLRTMISHATKDMPPVISARSSVRRKSGEGNGKIAQPLIWKGFSARKSENTAVAYGAFGSWDDPNTFTAALEKVEAWIFSRIVESIWWQSLTPHMQLVGAKFIQKDVGSASRKSYRRMPSTCDQEQGDLSLDIWKNAFREACERICPIRAGGHECGCLSTLPRLIMEQCVARLDVAMFNAILRESADDIPTDPVSDPIGDPKVLPIPPGKSSFGAGAQLKTVIGNWSRWLTDLFGMDDDDSFGDNNDYGDHYNNCGNQNTSFKPFHYLNALSDLLMLPKDMLLSASIRKEVCPMFSAPLIWKILDNFVPDEFCPDPIPAAVFEALYSQDDPNDEEEAVNFFPCIAAPIAYSPPPATSIASITGEIGGESHLRRSKSSVVRKSYTSDDELDELISPLSSILFSGSTSSSPVSAKPSWKLKENGNEYAVRYELLRDVWMNSE